MKCKINTNAVNQFAKGTEIYSEGEAVQSIALVIKGRIQIHNEGAKFLAGSGSFLGLNDLFKGSYQSTYTAFDDTILYIFAISRSDELENIFSINKDYRGFMVATLNKVIYELDQIYRGFIKNGLELNQFLTDKYKDYLDFAERMGYYAKTADRLKSLSILQSDLELERERIEYYKECVVIPIDVMKTFCSYGNTITLYQLEDQADVINQQLEVLEEFAGKLTAMAECLIDDSETCLFRLIAALSIEIVNAAGSSDMAMDMMDSIIEEINKIENFYERSLGSKFKVDRKKLEEIYHLLLTGTNGKEMSVQTYLKYSPEDTEKALAEFKDSFGFILDYSETEPDKAKEMKAAMNDFVGLKDRLSADDSARIIRRQLTDNHYLLYKKIFLKAYKDKKLPRIIDLFLKYGFADERLLSKEQLLSLYFLKEEAYEDNIHVYNIKEWLTLIYEGRKEPSKNEFDLEYNEALISLKKEGKITDKELPEWAANTEKKLDYEIQNMFRYNNRTTNGQISSFVPVLHKDMMINIFDKSHVAYKKVIDIIKNLLRIDYSIFDREVIFSDSTKKIVKEYIIKKTYPDIILMPTVGINGIMWQEITGKRRDSSGRFLLPIFCETDLSAILVRVLGRYRWEMCRSIEGTAWNDIKHKSLTSEYSDYLQFYRKNRELSEEKKEKIKQQIQRGRNSSREIFVIDYEQWVNNESTGVIKLNKPVREILATYCPFSREIREKLIIQPQFEEAMARYTRDKQKRIREIEGRYRLLQKDQIELTKELIDTLSYYKEK